MAYSQYTMPKCHHNVENGAVPVKGRFLVLHAAFVWTKLSVPIEGRRRRGDG